MKASKQDRVLNLSLYLGHVNKVSWYSRTQRQCFSVNVKIRSDIADPDANPSLTLGINGPLTLTLNEF